MNFARLIEKTIQILAVPTSGSSSTTAVDLNGADKFSIQVVATVGDSIAHLEGSNDGSNWTEVDNVSIAAGASDIFEQADVDYRWARITLENDDVVDVSADCLVLVIGDAE
jgi:hypothetical protein